MYLPKLFEVTDRAPLLELMQQYPFATLIAQRDADLEITHLPVLAFEREGELRIEAHVARANPIAPLIEVGAPLTVVFQGPHAYVSPRLYKNADNVPTWNYAVVHARGVPQVIGEPEAAMAHVREMTARFERAVPEPWVPERAGELSRKLLSALVAFRLVPQKLEAKFKLNQNRKPEDRQGVLDAFERGEPHERAVAGLMRRHPPR